MTSNNQPSNRLFIGSLPYRFTEGELLDLFVKFGRVVAVRIVKNRWGKSRGMGYVEFETIDQAQAAKTKMNNYYVEERTIIVDFAQPDPFTTPEGRQRHIEAQEKKPLEKRKFLDEFGNRKFAVPRPQSAPTPRRNSFENRFEPKSYGNRDRRYNDDRPARYDSQPSFDNRFSSDSPRSYRPSPSEGRFTPTSFDNRPKRNFSSYGKSNMNRSQNPSYQSRDNESNTNYFNDANSFDSRKRFSKGGRPKFNSVGKSLNKDQSKEFTPKFITDAPARPKSKFRPKFGQKPEYKASDPHHVRSSVFKQKKFGSRTGAKFAHKTKQKSK